MSKSGAQTITKPVMQDTGPTVVDSVTKGASRHAADRATAEIKSPRRNADDDKDSAGLTQTPTKRLKAATDSKKSAPARVGLVPRSHTLRSISSTGDIDDALPSKPRPADPYGSNAPFIGSRNLDTPHSQKITQGDASLGLTTPKMVTATTDTVLEQAKAHLLRVDAALIKHSYLCQTIEQNHCRVFDPEGLAEKIDPFRSLASGIIAQQVSGAAASSIKNKFIGLFDETDSHAGPPHFPAPELVATTSIERLRTAGLSLRKAEYIKGLAERFASGVLTAKMLAEAGDEEVMEKLVAVRGLGRWSVEMFCLFGLKRMDVFSTGDLGIQSVPACSVQPIVNAR